MAVVLIDRMVRVHADLLVEHALAMTTALVRTSGTTAASPLVSGKAVADASCVIAVAARRTLCVRPEGRHLGVNVVIRGCKVISAVVFLVQIPSWCVKNNSVSVTIVSIRGCVAHCPRRPEWTDSVGAVTSSPACEAFAYVVGATYASATARIRTGSERKTE